MVPYSRTDLASERGIQTGLIRHPASFRDPESGVFKDGDRLVRSFRGSAVADAKEAMNAGLLDALVREGSVWPFEVVQSDDGPDSSFAVAHERVPFISYPYEWSFSTLQAAALLHLDVLTRALESGFTLSDGSAYNIQFVGTRPVFIDLGSFRRHRDGAPWSGYAQFCRHFLYPLLFTAETGVPHQAWLRSSLDGIPPQIIRSLLPFRAKLRPSVMTHVVLHAALAGREVALDGDLRRIARVERPALLRTIEGLRKAIGALKAPREQSAWVAYERNATYSSEARAEKMAAVRAAVGDARPDTIWDLGCNVGTYTTAVAGDHSVVGMDVDPVSIDVFYRAASRAGTNVLPLVMDVTNPSPPQGWAHHEREGLTERGPADMALCLALIHHVRFSGGIPVPEFVQWLGSVARSAVLEFVPRSDPMVRRMLAWREDGACPDYSQEVLERELARTYTIAARKTLSGSDRILYILRPRWTAG